MGGLVYGAYYVLLLPLRPLGSDDPFCACVCEVFFLVCFEFFIYSFKEENVNCFCSPLHYSKKRKARDKDNISYVCQNLCLCIIYFPMSGQVLRFNCLRFYCFSFSLYV